MFDCALRKSSRAADALVGLYTLVWLKVTQSIRVAFIRHPLLEHAASKGWVCCCDLMADHLALRMRGCHVPPHAWLGRYGAWQHGEPP